MRLKRLLTCTAVAVVMAGAMPLPASAAGYPDPPLDPTVPAKGGVYVSAGGEANIHFTNNFTTKLEKIGAKFRYIKPFYADPKGPLHGFGMPVGSNLDTFTDPNRVTYPGGFEFSDHKGNSIAVNGVWLRFVPGGFFGAPWVNGKKVGSEMHLLAFSLLQAISSANLFTPHEGGVGPTNLHLRMTAEFADLINKFAEALPESGLKKPYVTAGEMVGVIDVAWRDLADAEALADKK